MGKQVVTESYKGSEEVKRVTGEYRGLHGFTRGCSRLQGITRSYRGLEEVIGSYKSLKGVTRGCKRLQLVTREFKRL